MQTEVLLFINLLRFDNPADKLLNLRNEPYQDKGIHHIEAGMESGKHETQLGGISKKGMATSQFF